MASYVCVVLFITCAPLFTQAIVLPEHVGCFEDTENGVLTDVSTLNENAYATIFETKNKAKTVNWHLLECAMQCMSRTYMYAGIRNGVKCYCGNNVEWNGLVTPDKCPIVCEQKYRLTCGGLKTTSVYKLNNMFLNQGVSEAL